MTVVNEARTTGVLRPSVMLDDQLCFALYAASKAVTARYRPMLDELGITYPQFLVLMLLWESDSKSVGALGERLNLDSGTLSPLLKRLAAAGFVRRTRSATDERSVIIDLTPEGSELRDRALPISAEMIEAIDMSPAEFTGLRAQLRRLADHMTGAPPH